MKRVLRFLLHLPSVAGAVTLIYINLVGRTWFSSDGPWQDGKANTLNALQLLAKIHEISVIYSLGSITIKTFKRKLVGSGLPLGFITAGYHVGDLLGLRHLRHFFHRTWWFDSTCWLAIFLAFVTLIATLVGPASAVLMLPELDWYELRGAFQDVSTPILYYPPGLETWPRSVDASIYPNGSVCTGDRGTSLYYCPAGGFAQISNWIGGWRHSVLANNLTFHEPAAALGRQLVFSKQPGGNVTYSTTVSMSSLLSIGRLLNYMKSHHVGTVSDSGHFRLETREDAALYQPLVQTQCRLYDKATLLQKPDRQVPFGTDEIACFGDSLCEQMVSNARDRSLDPRLWNETEFDPEFKYSLHAYGSGNQVTPLTVSLVVPYLDGEVSGVWVLGCAVMAHWVPVKMTISPSETDLVTSNVTDLLRSQLSSTDIGVGTAILIDKSWRQFLAPLYTVTRGGGTQEEQTDVDIMVRLIGQLMTLKSVNGTRVVYFNPTGTEPNGTLTRDFMEKTVGAIVTEGLARTASHGTTLAVFEPKPDTKIVEDLGQQWGLDAGNRTLTYNRTTGMIESTHLNSTEILEGPMSELDLFKHGTEMHFDVKQFKYGFGHADATRNFGLAVMFMYLIIVAFYHVGAAFHWLMTSSPAVSAWDDLLELLVLAWNSSHAYELSGASTQMDDKQRIWRLQTKIRATGKLSGRAQLVVGDNEDMFSLSKEGLYT